MLSLLKFLFGSPLERVLQTVENTMDSETERERIKAEAVKTYVQAQASILTGKGWWFPLFFIAPLGIWFAAVCIYSVLFCAQCAFPQPWSIAALPTPLDQWAGVIIGSLFLARYGENLLARLKK